MNKPVDFNNVDALVFDFDGVLTNNQVHLDQDGKEWVSCSRADGLAFDVLRKLSKPVFILSTEKNPVVSARANKLNVPVLQGVSDKVKALKSLAAEKNFNLENVLYVGNDLNDYKVIQICGLSACPIDSHPKISEITTFTLKSKGGQGVARELLEDVFDLDFLEILYL